MTSVLNVDTIAAKNGTSPVALTKQSAAKVWGSFVGGTAAISDSLNISSTADNGTGDHTANYTNALLNDDYSISGSCETARRYFSVNSGSDKTTTSVRFVLYVDNGTINDTDSSLVNHGDLA